MRITITAAQLEAAHACKEGVDAFRAAYGESTEQEWTRDVQIETLKGPLGRYVGWAYLNRLLPLWSMAGADLRSANLRSADLSYADLSYANLSYANLSYANLSYADLRYANLRYANLSYANLRYVRDLAGTEVCLCNSTPCTSLREMLAAAGWVPAPDGLLSRAAPVVSS